jgi:hypothetical protein
MNISVLILKCKLYCKGNYLSIIYFEIYKKKNMIKNKDLSINSLTSDSNGKKLIVYYFKLIKRGFLTKKSERIFQTLYPNFSISLVVI